MVQTMFNELFGGALAEGRGIFFDYVRHWALYEIAQVSNGSDSDSKRVPRVYTGMKYSRGLMKGQFLLRPK